MGRRKGIERTVTKNRGDTEKGQRERSKGIKGIVKRDTGNSERNRGILRMVKGAVRG